jgi:hypothetical protein
MISLGRDLIFFSPNKLDHIQISNTYGPGVRNTVVVSSALLITAAPAEYVFWDDADVLAVAYNGKRCPCHKSSSEFNYMTV